MNYLAKLNKNLREARESYGKIKGVDAKGKARESIAEFTAQVWGGSVETTNAVENVITGVSGLVAGANQGGEALPAALREDGYKRMETVTEPLGNVVGVTVGDKTTVFPPGASLDGLAEAFRNDGIVEVVGDLGGEEREIEPESMAVKKAVERVDEWPKEAEVSVGARCINPRVISGKLEDGRVVSIEKDGRNYKVNDKVKCALIRAGGSPRYRPVVGVRI